MECITRILEADRSTLYLIEVVHESNQGSDRMLVSRVAQEVDEIRLPIDENSIAGSAAKGGQVINLADAYEDARFNSSFDRLHGYRTRSLLAAPMRNPQGLVIGVAQAMNKRGGGRFDRDDEEMLLAFSSQACIAVENARYLDLQKKTFETLIHGQAVAIDARDHITSGHTWRVTAYAVEIGRTLGWEGEDLDLLRYAGLLHDQGKLGVPDEILLKPDRLADWEFQIIQSHAYKTKIILNSVRPFFPRRLRGIPEIAAAHHEKLDGSGYPDGLRGEELSMGARIVAVADIFDALTAHRPYRKPDADHTVIQMLRRDAEAGKLDNEAVEALEQSMPRIVSLREQINDRIKVQKQSKVIRHILKGEGGE
jgi:HD-GYP domain-containing protein (c-di-GMP phosphodiesterase class II)